MSDLFSGQSVTLTCPGCGHKFEEKIGRLKNDPEIPCPGCGKTIHVNASGLRSGLDSANKSIDDFKRSFGK